MQATIGTLVREQGDYIGALYSIVFKLQVGEFERSDDPLDAAIATANHMRRTFLNTCAPEDSMSRIVVEFFDQVAADIRSRMYPGQDSAHSHSTTEGTA